MDSLGLLGFLKAKKVKAEIDEINQPINLPLMRMVMLLLMDNLFTRLSVTRWRSNGLFI